MNLSRRIPVLLAEDQKIVREGLRVMLDLEEDIQVVDEARDGREAVAMAIKLAPAVVLMDIAMPQLNGLEATRRICKALPATKVIILSAHSSDECVRNAKEAGASGFLLKHESSIHDVYRAIRTVSQGKTYYSPQLSRRMDVLHASTPDRNGVLKPRACQLTSRQSEVLQCVAENRANKEIASELGIDIKTVEKHRKNLTEKLNLRGAAALTRYAISAGLIECEVSLEMV